MHLSDLNSGEIISSTITKGRGPGEILTSLPYISYCNKSLYVCDIATNRIKKVISNVDTLITNDYCSINYSNPTITAGMEAVSDSLFAIFGYSRTHHAIYLVDNKGNITDSITYSILNDFKIINSQVDPFYVSMRYSPAMNILYIINKTYNHIRAYRIKHKKIHLISEYALTQPMYKVKSGKPIQMKNNLTLWGELFVGEKYIYLVANPELRSDFEKRRDDAYSQGSTFTALPGKDSYIFDNDLNLLKSYLCDSHFTWIALTDNSSVVYASDKRNHCLTKYILEGLD